jgi:hypothetical protein
MSEEEDLKGLGLLEDDVGLLEGLTTTRSIRRYTKEPISKAALRSMLFAATRAPSGSNRQPFRFIVLTDGPKARAAKELIGGAARNAWGAKRRNDGYDSGSGTRSDSPKARMARTMEEYVDNFEECPALVLPCMVRYREPHLFEGASRGGHGPVRRLPLDELVFEESWNQSPDWAVDPPGTRYTRAGPPKKP